MLPTSSNCLVKPMLAPLSLAVLSLFAAPAMAVAPDSFKPYVSIGLTHDDNLFHLNNSDLGDALIGTRDLGDTSRRLGIGIDIEKQLSQQRLFASLNLNRTQYNHFTQLNNDGKDLSAHLNWHFGSHVDGNVGGSYVESLTPVTSFRTQDRNSRTDKHVFADAGWQFHPSWRVRGALAQDRLRYDLESQRANNRNLSSEEVGLDYLGADSATIGVQVGHSTGAYQFPEVVGMVAVANDYTQNELKGKVDAMVTGKTRLQFLGGWVERRHAAFDARDYRGLNGRLIATWAATGKINVIGNLWHEIGSVDDLTASYSVNNGISADATWDLSAKVRLAASLRNEQRRYAGDAALPILQLSTRRDTYRNVSLTGIYLPTRNWQFNLTGYHDQTSSNFDPASYRSNGVAFQTRYAF